MKDIEMQVFKIMNIYVPHIVYEEGKKTPCSHYEVKKTEF